MTGPLVALALAVPTARAQAVEVLVGHERSSIDTMFFVYFPQVDPDGARKPSEFLLFQRVRGSFGYDDDDPLDVAGFGITTAVSWNSPALVGFAPVLVGQLLSAGPFAKAGVQIARVDEHATVFGWAVVELGPSPAVDGFLLGRYNIAFSKRAGLSIAAEALATVPTAPDGLFVFVQRARVGFRYDGWQVGPGLDLGQVGRDGFVTSVNVGGFLRHDF